MLGFHAGRQGLYCAAVKASDGTLYQRRMGAEATVSLLVSSVWLASKTSRMVEYMEKKRMWRKYPDLNFGGPFTTVSVTEGVSDIAHTDRNDAGLTWVVPMGKWEGGDLCIPFYKIKIPIKEGEAIAFQAISWRT